MAEILETAINSAKLAGDFLSDNFGKISRIESKGDKSLVTNLDQKAEKIIREQIQTKFPSHGIIGEEEGRINKESQYIWIIDPLDGTHNYIRNMNLFGVSIGVVYKDKFIAGVVYMPQENQLYTAESGAGAFRNDKKISVSSCDRLDTASIAFDSSIRHSPEVMLKTLGGLAEEVFNIRMFGSSARTLTYVAEGGLDCAVEFHDRPWDFAGSVAIIEEAGGKLASLKNQRLTYKTVGYIASNQTIHQQISAIVAKYL